MAQISVVIITKNEEKNILRCLESVKDIADEIIVVDSNSTDKTESICLSYGAKFFTHAFEGYVKQKNFANSLASNEWILNLDADEALSPLLVSSIKKIKPQLNKGGYLLSRKNQYCGQWLKWGGWYPDLHLRLWNKNDGQWEGKMIHEKVILQHPARASRLDGDILHFTYHSIHEHAEQANKFSEISANVIYQSGEKTTIFVGLVLNPLYTFIHKYIIQLGFLDGKRGFIAATISAYSNFLKYSKIKMLEENNENITRKN